MAHVIIVIFLVLCWFSCVKCYAVCNIIYVVKQRSDPLIGVPVVQAFYFAAAT